MKHFIHTTVEKAAMVSSVISALCLLGMMGVTCLDVTLRLFRCPIAGAYETVGFLGALMVAFALADTGLKGGHISVDFLVQKCPESARAWLGRGTQLTLILLLALLTLGMGAYALELKASAEVSMTLKIPLWPVAFGLCTGLGLFVCVLITRLK